MNRSVRCGAGLWTAIALLALAVLAGLGCGRPAVVEVPATATLAAMATHVPTVPPRPAPTAAPAVTPTPVPMPAPTPAPAAPAPDNGPVRLPRDEGRHSSPIEWWYFNGHLTDGTGNGFSYHYVTFEFVTPQGVIARLLQYSWLDHRQGQWQRGEQFYVVNLPTPGSQPGATGPAPYVPPGPCGIDIRTGSLVMAGDGTEYRLVFQPGGMEPGSVALDLTAVSVRPALLHQETGVVDLGPAGITRYYTRPRLETTGTLTVDGETRQVEGLSWMDHQWGDAATALNVGWDWLGLQLDDGADLMVSIVWDVDTGELIGRYGTLSLPAVAGAESGGPVYPTPVYLTGGEISLTATGSWVSPATGGAYPVGWELSINSSANNSGADSAGSPLSDLSLTLAPVAEDAEFPPSPFVPVDYWEGAVTAAGTLNGAPISGRGFVEMVGYAPRRALTPPAPPR